MDAAPRAAPSSPQHTHGQANSTASGATRAAHAVVKSSTFHAPFSMWRSSLLSEGEPLSSSICGVANTQSPEHTICVCLILRVTNCVLPGAVFKAACTTSGVHSVEVGAITGTSAAANWQVYPFVSPGWMPPAVMVPWAMPSAPMLPVYCTSSFVGSGFTALKVIVEPSKVAGPVSCGG